MMTVSKKVCLLGDFAVGKTSLVRRFVYNAFDDKYISTLGVKVSRKAVVVPRADDVVEVVMMLWDLAGSEEFNSVRASYLRGAAGAVLVCDLTRPETLDSLEAYARDVQQTVPHAVNFILAANKTDLADQQRLTRAQVEAVAARLNAPVYTTSARVGAEVDELFRHLATLLT